MNEDVASLMLLEIFYKYIKPNAINQLLTASYN
jgi:hypothetical protein